MGDADPVHLETLTTPRLVLEPLVAAHADAMYVVLSDPAIYEFENAPPASLDALRGRYRRLESRRSPDGRELWLNWVACLKEDGWPIGYVQATVGADRRALLAYEFGSAWWGRGLAREAVAALIEHLALDVGVAEAGAVFKRANHRSRRLLERLGMRAAKGSAFPRALCEDDEDAMVLLLPRAA